MIEHVDNLENFEGLREGWDDLSTGIGLSGPTLMHDWFAAWLSAFHRDDKLSVIAMFDGQTLVGAAPSRIVKSVYRRVPCRQLQPLLNRHVPACAFMMRDGHEPDFVRLMDAVFALPDWDVVWFDNIRFGSYLYDFCADLAKSGDYPIVLRRSMSSPFLMVDGTWEDFLASRSRNCRRSLRRNERRLRAAGEVTVTHATDASDCVRLMPTLTAIGERSWKAPGGRAIGSQEESRRFYTTLVERFGRRGNASIWLLELDNEPAAFEFHLRRGGYVQALRAEFDDRFRSLGVGSVLDKEIVKSLFETGVKEYHMGGSPDPYKMRWTDNVIDHYEFLMFGRSTTGRMLHTLEKRLVQPLKVLLKRDGPQ